MPLTREAVRGDACVGGWLVVPLTRAAVRGDGWGGGWLTRPLTRGAMSGPVCVGVPATTPLTRPARATGTGRSVTIASAWFVGRSGRNAPTVTWRGKGPALGAV